MKRSLVLLMALIFSQLSLGAILTLVREGNVELYDVSIPLLPVRLGVVEIPNTIKLLSYGNLFYILGQLKIEMLDSNLTPIKSVELDRKIIDAVLIDDIYILHDYSITVFDRDLRLKATYAVNEKINKIDTYSDLLVALTDGKIVAFDRRMRRVWEVSAPDPIIAMQVVGDSLMFSTTKEFYVMNLTGSVPVFEAKHRFTMDFQQIVSSRNGLIVLTRDKSILFLSPADFSVKDRLNISAVSIIGHRDYLYVVTDRGNVTIVSILPNSLKSFQTFGTGVKWASLSSLSIPQTTTTNLSIQLGTSTASKPQEEKKEEVQNLLTFLSEIKLPQKVNNSLALGNVFYASSLDGNLFRIDPRNWKVQSNKIAFILTADPVLLEDDSIVLGGWDKNIYIISDRINKIPVESSVSLPAARIPNGFVAVDDAGMLYLIDLKGFDSPRKIRLAGWFICPPAVHEKYGIILLDWLGILRLIDFSGKEVWSLVTKAAKSGEIIVAADTAFVITQDTVWSIDIKNGRIKWSESFDDAELIQAVCDLKILYICDSLGRVRALDFSGKTLWLKEGLFARTILSTQNGLLVAGDKLYLVSSKDGSVTTQENLPDLASGKLKLNPQGLLTVVVGDRLLIYRFNGLPSPGWPMYLKDAVNSSLFTN